MPTLGEFIQNSRRYGFTLRLTENQVRSLCSQLGILTEDFGLPDEAS
jgi:hypothetical protein